MPALLPATAPSAARRPSRAAIRTIIAVPGPGVSVTTRATSRNSSTPRTLGNPAWFGKSLSAGWSVAEGAQRGGEDLGAGVGGQRAVVLEQDGDGGLLGDRVRRLG